MTFSCAWSSRGVLAVAGAPLLNRGDATQSAQAASSARWRGARPQPKGAASQRAAASSPARKKLAPAPSADGSPSAVAFFAKSQSARFRFCAKHYTIRARPTSQFSAACAFNASVAAKAGASQEADTWSVLEALFAQGAVDSAGAEDEWVDPVLPKLLDWLSERSDVQSCATMLLLLGPDACGVTSGSIPHETARGWVLDYVELLQRLCMWDAAADVQNSSTLLLRDSELIEAGSGLVPITTVFCNSNCLECGAELSAAGSHCAECRTAARSCSICHLPVRGLGALLQLLVLAPTRSCRPFL